MKFEDLKLVRLTMSEQFNLIPKYLFEQIKDRSWDIERLYEIAPISLTNEANRFWVLVNDEHTIKGILWILIDTLSEKLNVFAFSIDEEYQDDSNLGSVRDYLGQFIEGYNKNGNGVKLKEKINWVTSQPELFEEVGGQPLKTVMVEI